MERERLKVGDIVKFVNSFQYNWGGFSWKESLGIIEHIQEDPFDDEDDGDYFIRVFMKDGRSHPEFDFNRTFY